MKRITADVIFLLLLALLLCSWVMPSVAKANPQSITIPTAQWEELKSECRLLNSELTECHKELQKLKKPSQELLNELASAQDMLTKLQADLERQKTDLILLSKEAEELRTLSTKLKEQISKERKIRNRQIWQNRVWCLLIGVGIGATIK